MDRFEAYKAATEQPSNEQYKQILLSALSDKYYGLRIRAIKAIKTDDKQLIGSALPVVTQLATNDVKYPVRTAAIDFLAKTNSSAYKEMYKEALTSPSFNVRASALTALNSIAPDEAFTVAKTLAPKAEGPITMAIAGVYAKNGSDAEWPFFIDAFNNASGQAKFDNAVRVMPTIMGRLNNRTFVAQGINAVRDLAVTYKKYGIAPKLISSLDEIAKQRKAKNDDQSVDLAHKAIEYIKDVKE